MDRSGTTSRTKRSFEAGLTADSLALVHPSPLGVAARLAGGPDPRIAGPAGDTALLGTSAAHTALGHGRHLPTPQAQPLGAAFSGSPVEAVHGPVHVPPLVPCRPSAPSFSGVGIETRDARTSGCRSPPTARLSLSAARRTIAHGGEDPARDGPATAERRPWPNPDQAVIEKGLLRSKMCASILDGRRRRLALRRHERAAVHREGSQMGAKPESGGAFRGLRRRRFAWNTVRGRPQDNRQGPEERNRQGTARQDARRPRDRQGRFLEGGTTDVPPEDQKHA